MSQLNNDGKEELEGKDNSIQEELKIEDNKKAKKEKRPLSRNIKIIIILIIFIVISILITVGAIYWKLRDNKSNNEEDTLAISTGNKLAKSKEEKYALTSLTEMCSENSIEIKHVKYKDTNDSKYSINYVQIDGLKDKSIQDKINKEIKEEAFRGYDKSNKDIDSYYVYVSVEANYSNVLSLYISKSTEYTKTSKKEPSAISTCLNYRLDTGEKIKFEDLFVNYAPINYIIASSLYKYLAQNEKGNEEDGLAWNLDKIDTSEYEDYGLNVVNKYQANKDIKFYFNLSRIYLTINGVEEVIRIEMADYYTYMAIFKRYADAKNIYNNELLSEKKTFVLAKRNFDYSYYFGDVSDNLWVTADFDYYLEDLPESTAEKTKNKIFELIDSYIANIKAEAKADSKKGIIYNILVSADSYLNENKIRIYIAESKSTMNKDYYSKNAHELVAEISRLSNGGSVELYDFSRDENIKSDIDYSISLEYDLNLNLIKSGDVNIYSEN